jgi:D-glycero-beta-D-manno-heptose 1-phosphate adenylyltransferase
MEPTSQKIVDVPTAKVQMEQWQQTGQQIVFTNGCFDIVHLGHVDYLEKARAKGQKLVLGLNSDLSVTRLKGSERPLVHFYARARLLAALSFVDLVVGFEEDTPLDLIKTLQPDILIKGSDYSIENIVGAKEVISWGGSVQTIDLVDGFSTSALVAKIKNLSTNHL